MRRNFLIMSIIIFSVIPLLNAESLFQRQKRIQDEMVDRQKTEDLQRKEAILRKIRGFMKDINGRLKQENKTRIDIPLNIDDATDIKDTDHFHTKKAVPPREFAYINTSRVRLRASGTTKSEIVGHVRFKEQIEVLNMTYEEDKIFNISAPWYLIRRENNEEGWLFGAFIQKTVPEKAIDFSKKERKEIKDKGGIRGKFHVPAIGKLTSQFGYRIHPVSKRRSSFHKGIDIAAPRGTPVKAASGGIVQRSEYNRHGYGNLIVIEHEKGLSTYYGHLSVKLTRRGRRVKKGELIGKVGSTGMSTGPHLHFEVRRGRKALNPSEFLR